MNWPRPYNVMQAVLALLLVLAFLAAGLALFRWVVPSDNRELLTYMLGQLSGMVTTALAFYYATTKSSADKNRVIADAALDRSAGIAAAPEPVDLPDDPYPRPQFGKGEE